VIVGGRLRRVSACGSTDQFALEAKAIFNSLSVSGEILECTVDHKIVAKITENGS
jgi:hypothetical protein